MTDNQSPDKRYVQTSVTNFLYCGNEYLFLHRSKDKKIDPGKLNAIGGKLEPREDFLTAAIRETEEETGYIVKPDDIRLVGVVKLEGGYEEDWVMCFYKIRVPDKKIPKGKNTPDGTLLWLHKDKVLDSGYELVDDLYYTFEDIVAGEKIIFLTAQVGEDHKIHKTSVTKL